VTGEIAEGVVYSSKALAAELGVSNGPIREAMLALVDDGLMEAVPNKGFRLIPITEHDLAEIYEMRLVLEVHAIGKLSETGVGDRLDELTRLVDLIEQTARDGDVAGNLQADRDFHIGLMEATGNQRLARTVTSLRDQTRLFNLRNLAATGQLMHWADEHRPLLAAITAGDRTTAEALMREHLAHVPGDWSTSPAGQNSPGDPAAPSTPTAP
jgi:DNA-binding GntR family transcriptional regulator